MQFILDHIEEDRFTFSFGGGDIDFFLKMWGLDESPNDSDFWNEMTETIVDGFLVYSPNYDFFVAPYAFVNIPGEGGYDPFEYFVCTGSGVNLEQKIIRIVK